MRTTDNPNRFEPEPAPATSLEALSEYVFRGFVTMSGLLNMLADGQLEAVTVEPTKKRHGMLRLADGTFWNPGSGRGVYWYDSVAAAWKFLG